MLKIEADEFKSAIAFFNKFISTSEKDNTWVKIEDTQIDDSIYLMLSVVKGDLGFRYRFLIETPLNFRGCVIYSKLQEVFKTMKKKDIVSFEIEADNLHFNEMLVPYHVTKKGPKYDWKINGSVSIDYWEEIMVAHKYASNKSVYDISNRLFFNLSENKLETINTNEILLIYNKMEAEVWQPLEFGISHQAISSLLKWSSISKGVNINIMTFGNLVSFFDGKSEIVINRIDDKCFESLKKVSDKKFENYGFKDISLINDKTIKTFSDNEGKILPYVELENIRVQKKVLDNILELSGLNYYIPKNNLEPIVFELDEDEVYLKILLLPIDKEKQI